MYSLFLDLITLESVNSRASARHFLRCSHSEGCPAVTSEINPITSAPPWHLLFVHRQVATATLSAGRFARIGMRVPKERQNKSPSVRSSLDEHDVPALKFLSFMNSAAPPRAVLFDNKLSFLWVTKTISLRTCCTTESSHIPSWQRKPSPSLQRFGNTETPH